MGHLKKLDDYIKSKKYLQILLVFLIAVMVTFLALAEYFWESDSTSLPMGIRTRRVQDLYSQLTGIEEIKLVTGSGHGQMYYIFLAYLMKWFGFRTPDMAFVLIQAVGIGLIFGIFPFSMFYGTKSYKAAAISDFILLFTAHYLAVERLDSYWAGYTAIIISLPLLIGLFLESKWKWREWIICGLLVILFALCNLPRSQSSMAGLALLSILLLWRGFLFRNKKRFYALCIVVLTIFSIQLVNSSDKLLLRLYYCCGGPLRIEFNDVPWHSMYIGLGYLENEYNIYYADECAYEYVESINPEAKYPSEEYMQILKEGYFSIMFENPIFFIKVNLAKLMGCIQILYSKIVSNKIGLIVIVAAFGFFLDMRSMFKTYFIIMMCAVLGMAQGVLAVPRAVYITPGIGAIIVFNVYLIIDAMKALYSWIREMKKKLGLL